MEVVSDQDLSAYARSADGSFEEARSSIAASPDAAQSGETHAEASNSDAHGSSLLRSLASSEMKVEAERLAAQQAQQAQQTQQAATRAPKKIYRPLIPADRMGALSEEDYQFAASMLHSSVVENPRFLAPLKLKAPDSLDGPISHNLPRLKLAKDSTELMFATIRALASAGFEIGRTPLLSDEGTYWWTRYDYAWVEMDLMPVWQSLLVLVGGIDEDPVYDAVPDAQLKALPPIPDTPSPPLHGYRPKTTPGGDAVMESAIKQRQFPDEDPYEAPTRRNLAQDFDAAKPRRSKSVSPRDPFGELYLGPDRAGASVSATTRLRPAATADLKSFNGRDRDDEVARAWLSQLCSAGRRDQLEGPDMCDLMADQLAGPVKNWLKQLPEHVRRNWNQLVQAFQEQYCDIGRVHPERYYNMTRFADEDPLDYFYRLNVEAMRAGIKYRGGKHDQAAHIDRFLNSVDDAELVKSLSIVGVASIFELGNMR